MKRLPIVALLVSLAFGAKRDKTPPVVSIVSPKAGAVPMRLLSILLLLPLLSCNAPQEKRKPLMMVKDVASLAVSITNPSPGAIVSGIVPVQLSTTNANGATLVTVTVNGEQTCVLKTSPATTTTNACACTCYACNWNSVSPAGGSRTIVVVAQDATGSTANASIAVNAAPQLRIVTTTLPGGIVGVPYHQNLYAVGGIQPYSWSLSSGKLPAGLKFSQADYRGVLYGTPTVEGDYSFVVSVQDAAPGQRAWLAVGPHVVKGGSPQTTPPSRGRTK